MSDQIEGSVRRLAAVWFADIVGYTRLSGSDENLALHLVNVLQEAGKAEVAAQGGRVVKYIGDAVLAEFQSTESAVRAALALNDRFEAVSLSAGHAAKLRIGVHVGDVLGTADGDLYGDGINTASRVQGAADPGHIWVTKDVWNQLRARRDFRFDSVGERAFKGLDAKLGIYRVRPAAKAAETASDEAAAAPAASVNRATRYARLVRVALFYLVSAGVLLVLTGVLRNYLSLAEWVMPGGVLLLIIGFAVTLATEWAQSRPLPAVDGDEHPIPVPWLTWRRALVGGVSAYTLLFVTAGAYRLATEPGDGIQEVSAQGDSLQEPAQVNAALPDAGQSDSGRSGAAQPGATQPDAAAPSPSDPVPTSPTTTATPPLREPAPSAYSDAASEAYDAAHGRADAARRSAMTAGATGSQQTFARAETERTQAMNRATQGRFDEAAAGMNRARGLYDDAKNGALLEQRVDSILDALGPLESAARLTGSNASQVRQLRDDAEEAQRAGRYDEAIRLLQQVADRYRSAAAAQASADAAARQAPTNTEVRPPVAQPQPEPVAPAPPPRASKEEIAAQVLAEIRQAIEAKDMNALRAVWQLTPTQAQGFTSGWPIMGNLKVGMETTSVEEAAGSITVRVNMRYDFQNLSDARRPVTQRSTQTFTITQQGTRWVAVSSGL
jgi:class 3 adenylate cyclase